MRATPVLNHILQVPGARISDVTFTDDGVIATIARKYAPYHPRCSGCGHKCTVKEARERTFRHLDACGLRVWLKCEVRRVHCPDCGDVYERVPWARGASKYTSQFEDVSAFGVQQSNQSAVSLLMRVAWRTIGKIITRVAAELLDPGRLDGLVHIAVDEVCYGAEHRFLTCVANHRTRRIIYAAEGRGAAVLQGFFDQLTPAQRASIEAVSMDMSAGYEKGVRACLPAAEVCFDPFHVTQLAGKAADSVRRSEWRKYGGSGAPHGKWLKGVRFSMLRHPSKQTNSQICTLAELAAVNEPCFHAALLNFSTQELYRVPADQAPAHLDALIDQAESSGLKPFLTFAQTLRKHKDGILAAIRLGLSNGMLEALNSKTRLLSHRAFGFHSAGALTAMIYLCSAGVNIKLPHR